MPTTEIKITKELVRKIFLKIDEITPFLLHPKTTGWRDYIGDVTSVIIKEPFDYWPTIDQIYKYLFEWNWIAGQEGVPYLTKKGYLEIFNLNIC